MGSARTGTVAAAAVLAGGAAGVAALLARGRIALDLQVGRSARPLGPLAVEIDAPRTLVFEVVSSPYLGRTPRAVAAKLEVIERGEDMVLAAHHTDIGRFVTTTLETVRFEPPSSVHFRLVRGPVPLVVEQFAFTEEAGRTTLAYTGELTTELWTIGRWWGSRVAEKWEHAVRSSLASIKAEAERRSDRGRAEAP
jgi:Polyketide cyclase / dehydrase and lipid transport